MSCNADDDVDPDLCTFDVTHEVAGDFPIIFRSNVAGVNQIEPSTVLLTYKPAPKLIEGIFHMGTNEVDIPFTGLSVDIDNHFTFAGDATHVERIQLRQPDTNPKVKCYATGDVTETNTCTNATPLDVVCTNGLCPLTGTTIGPVTANWHRRTDSAGTNTSATLEYRVKVVDPSIPANYQPEFWTSWKTTKLDYIAKPVAENFTGTEAKVDGVQNGDYLMSVSKGAGNGYYHIENTTAATVEITNLDKSVGILTVKDAAGESSCIGAGDGTDPEICTYNCQSNGLCQFKLVPLPDFDQIAEVDYRVKSVFPRPEGGGNIEIWSEKKTISVTYRPVALPEVPGVAVGQHDYEEIAFEGQNFTVSLQEAGGTSGQTCATPLKCGYSQANNQAASSAVFKFFTDSAQPTNYPCTVFNGPTCTLPEILCDGGDDDADPAKCSFNFNQPVADKAGYFLYFRMTAQDVLQEEEGEIKLMIQPVPKVVTTAHHMGTKIVGESFTAMNIEKLKHYTYDNDPTDAPISNVKAIQLRSLQTDPKILCYDPTDTNTPKTNTCPYTDDDATLALNQEFTCTNGTCLITDNIMAIDPTWHRRTDSPATDKRGEIQYRVKVVDDKITNPAISKEIWSAWYKTEFELIDKPVADQIDRINGIQNETYVINIDADPDPINIDTLREFLRQKLK